MTSLCKYDVVVFDLDDTLYNEINYVESGYLCLAEHIENLYGIGTKQLFLDCLRKRDSDTIGKIIRQFNLPTCIKSDLINVYRFHTPSIELNEGVDVLLRSLCDNNIPLFIITDGRSFTQRQKISALGITDYFENIYISEEVGEGKPNPLSFDLINRKYPQSKIVYIGDNPKKDFIAPNKLGWDTIGILNSANRIHGIPDDYEASADTWLNNISELSC